MQAPTPIPSLPGVAFSGDIVPSTLLSYGYNLAADGKYLVCLSYAGAHEWQRLLARHRRGVGSERARSATTRGDLGVSGLGNSIESIGDLRAGTNTLSLLSSVATPTPLNGRLVPLSAAEGLAARRVRHQRQPRRLPAPLLPVQRHRPARATRCA